MKTIILLLAVTLLAVAQQPTRVRTASPIVTDSVTTGSTGTVVIGSVLALDRIFDVRLDDAQLVKLQAQLNAHQRSTGAPVTTTSDFRLGITSEAISKLRTLFPTGVPEGSAQRLKITIYFNWGPPKTVGVLIEF